MANQLAFDPAGRFLQSKGAAQNVRGQQFALQQAQQNAPRQNALADLQLREAQRGEQDNIRTSGVSRETSRVKFLNQAGKALSQVGSLEGRREAVRLLQPLMQQVGVDSSVFTDERLTNDSIKKLIDTTEGFSRNPQDLERAKLDIRERELAQRRELIFAKPQIAGETTARKLEAEKGLKAEVAGEVEKAKTSAKSSGKVIDKAFERVGKIRQNIFTIDRAIGALNRGAKTGAIQKFVPSITAASRELNQIQSELGLDVVGATTFGALSKGELDLALTTALDLGQSEEVLIDILTRKKVAQNKLMEYLNEQIQFLDAGGTVAGFLQQKQAPQQEVAPEQQQEGQLMIDANGNKAMVFPDGTFEEVQ